MEYKQRFKEHIKVLKAYIGRVPFWNSPGSTTQEISTMGMDVEIGADVEKARVLPRGK